MADEYLGRMKANGAASATIDKTEWLLKKLAAPIAKRPVRDIHHAELLKLLQQIEKSGRRETARRLRGVISSVYKYAIVSLRAEENPTLPLHGALLRTKVVGRAAITDEREFGRLLTALNDYDGWPTIKAAM